jgi:putative toxin-antitoxin system antitoxin component (TIGR02293 family)
METQAKYGNWIDTTNIDNQFIANEAQMAYHARNGVKADVFYLFAEAIKISNNALAGLLHLSSRTLSNYQQTKKALEPVQGEHLLKLIALYNKGVELFGSVDEFNYWLNKPFWNALEKPIDWLITPGGVDLVSLELERLGYGYPV